MSTNKFKEVQAENLLRKKRLEEGKYNCLPFPFRRFRKIYPGFERSKFILITANQKVGKSKLADYLFIYEPLFFMVEHPEAQFKIKDIYFSLEMSATEKYNEFLCHLLYRLDGIHIDTRTLRSVDSPCDQHILDLLETERYQKYIKAYEDMVIFNDTDKNPTGIRKFYREYALNHGHYNYTTVKVPNELGIIEEKQILDPINPYTQDDEEEWRIIILDNAANVSTEKGFDTQRAAIEKVSKDGITAKKQLKYIFVLIQHQAQAQEGIENLKLDRLLPSADGLGNNKETIRDVNCAMGLFNPAKFDKREFKKYDIVKLRGYARFLNIIDDRDYGAAGAICPLLFDGAISNFAELPLPNDSEGLNKVYNYIDRIESLKLNKDKNTLLFTNIKRFSNKLANNKVKKYICSLLYK